MLEVTSLGGEGLKVAPGGAQPRRDSSLTSYMVLDELLHLFEPQFPICKMVLILAHTSQDCRQDQRMTHVNHVAQWLPRRGLDGCSAGSYVFAYSTFDPTTSQDTAALEMQR